MRLWTLHPKHLDPAGLVALWREGLLARAVLRGKTRGYRRHPQLTRFRATPRPVAAVNAYLAAVCDEADARGYKFNRSKIAGPRRRGTMPESRGQLLFEWNHLDKKLRRRNPLWRRTRRGKTPRPHPLFTLVPGPVRDWEKAA